MNKDNLILTEARTMLREHLELEANGYKCSNDALYNILLGVARLSRWRRFFQNVTSLPQGKEIVISSSVTVGKRSPLAGS